LGLVAALPLAADAMPIVPGAQVCDPGADHCAVVDIVDPASATFAGEFTFDNDVALFQFVLDPGEYNFSAATNSYDPGFDPFLALYSRTATDPDGGLVTFGDGPFVATNDNAIDVAEQLEPFDLDAALAFQLSVTTRTEYILALIQAGNEAKEDILAFSWDDPFFRCISGTPDCTAGEFTDFYTGLPLTGAFSLLVAVAPVGSTPVPEPGTLSLLALGAAGAALARRRRARLEPR
jgi:hypothetical protein